MPAVTASGRLRTIRQVVQFVLGIAVIVDALFQPGPNVPELVVGLVLLGLVTVEETLGSLPL